MTFKLPDTSAWVHYLRRGPEDPWGSQVGDALENSELLTCGPVVAELLTGTSERDRERLSATLRALDWVDLGRSEWIAVGELAAELRSAGETVPLTDVSIAVAALEAEAELLTADSDFDRIARVEPALRLRLLSG